MRQTLTQPILFQILGTLALMVLLPLGAEASSVADRVLPVEMDTAGGRAIAVDPLLQQTELKVSSTDGFDQDGGLVGVYGDTGEVGARRADGNAIGVNAEGGNKDFLGCNTPPPVADKLTAEYYVPEPSNALKQIRVESPAASEQVIWILTGAPAGSAVFDNTGAQEFGVGTVNSEFRITGGTNGNRLTMRGNANNGTVLGTWAFDAKLKNTNDNCESTTTTDFTVTANQPSVGGTLSDLEGDQVVLQNNGGDDQVLTADGSFTFSPQDNGTDYDVTVLTQPSGPSQTCTVLNGTGTLPGADIRNVEVNCTTDQFSVGGTISGLQGDQVVLQNNSGNDQVLTADGSFTFSAQDDGTDYEVTVGPSARATEIDTCRSQPCGLDDQVLIADGGFTFAPQNDGTGYDVTVATQPSDPSQTCSVSNGSGTLAGADVTNVEINCSTDQFTVGGTVSGLEGDQVVLQNNGGDDQVLTADGGFTFAPQDDGTGYEVTVTRSRPTPVRPARSAMARARSVPTT